MCTDPSRIELCSASSCVRCIFDAVEQPILRVRAAGSSRSCAVQRGERAAVDPAVLHRSRVMPMAGWERLWRSQSANICVYWRALVASSPKGEDRTLTPRTGVARRSLYYGFVKVLLCGYPTRAENLYRVVGVRFFCIQLLFIFTSVKVNPLL